MGCCSSREQSEHTVVVPRNVSTTDKWVLPQQPFLQGCKLSSYTAACPASYPYEALSRVVQGDGHLFAAVFDGIGGAQAARHCVANCYKTLAQLLLHGEAPDRALRQMLLQLDASFFASALPNKVKANVGATAVVLFLNTHTGQCFVARLGNSRPFLGRSRGAFSQATVDVHPLSTHTNHTSLLPQLAAASQQAAVPLASQQQARQRDQATSSWYSYVVPDEFAAASPVVYTRCIGMGYGKDMRYAGHRDMRNTGGGGPLPQLPFITANAEVLTHQVSPGDDTIILSSEGVLEFVSPEEASLLVQHFSPTRLQALRQAYMQESVPGPEADASSIRQQPIDTLRASQAGGRQEVNIASVVMHHAIAKALTAHNRSYQQQLNKGNLQALDLRVDLEALRPAPGSKGSAATLALPQGLQASGLCKRDVHGDMGLVLVALEWPSMLPDAPNRLPLGTSYGSRRAKYHWQLVRQAAKFHMARRRQLLGAWFTCIDSARRQAQEMARQTEVAAWRLLGQAVQVNASGDVVEEGDQTPCRTPTKQPRTPVSGRLSGGKGSMPNRPPSSFSVCSAASITPTKAATPGSAAKGSRPGTAGSISSRPPVKAGMSNGSHQQHASRSLSLRSSRRPSH